MYPETATDLLVSRAPALQSEITRTSVRRRDIQTRSRYMNSPVSLADIKERSVEIETQQAAVGNPCSEKPRDPRAHGPL